MLDTALLDPIQNYRAGVARLTAEAGRKAEVFTSVNDSGKCFRARLYANGICGSTDMDFSVEGDTLAELLCKLQEKWAQYSATHRARTTRKMALAIIRLTAELGECTDAALRNCGEFDHTQVTDLGEAACNDANEIAGKGPFTIVAIGGANAEAA
jgi:hypothetical protein